MANWFDPDVPGVRLALVFVMLASLLMAVAVPEGFGDHTMLFAASYCALQIGRNGFVVDVTPAGRFNRNLQQILTWSILSAPLWIGGALADGGARWALWLTALGIDLAAPLLRYWLPRSHRTRAAHMFTSGTEKRAQEADDRGCFNRSRSFTRLSPSPQRVTASRAGAGPLHDDPCWLQVAALEEATWALPSKP